MEGAAPAGPHITDSGVELLLPDPDHALSAVRLYQEVERPRLGPAFERHDGVWRLQLARPDVDRLEYQLALTHADGGEEWIVDPGNPRTADSPFGPKSVIEFPGYAPPAWLAEPPAPAPVGRSLSLRSRGLRRPVRFSLATLGRAPAQARLPLLIVADGPEYSRLSGLVALLALRVRDGTLPPLRVLLHQPGSRDAEYSASPGFARALDEEVLPAVRERVGVAAEPRLRVGVGASLGGLAMLHAQRTRHGLLGGLFLQSPSFFRRGHDDCERWLPAFSGIVGFVDAVVAAPAGAVAAVPTVLTCGSVEENLVGNREVAAALTRQGYPVTLHEVRDAHSWTAWRDALEPHLVGLLRDLWG